MIRPANPEETDALVELARQTGVFKPAEVQALREVLDEYHAGLLHGDGHCAVVAQEDLQAVGFAYFAPAEMAERTWQLWWIAVSTSAQARGVGAHLLGHAEDHARQAQGRVMFIETSSLPHYDLTRRFYLRHGYEQHAELRDYYAEGDDMIIFRKAL